MYLKKVLSLLFTLVALTAVGQTFSKELVFDKKIHDFGTIDENAGIVSCRFRVTNRGSKPMTIVSARGGCSCVKGVVPKRPIQPGKSDYITVTFDPEYRPGHFSKELTVMTADRKYSRIWVKGDVKPGRHDIPKNYPYNYGSDLYGSYKQMIMASAPGKWRSMKLRLGNNSKRAVTVSFIQAAKGFVVIVPKAIKIAAGGETAVDVRVCPEKASKTPLKGSITPVINGRRLTSIPLELHVTK